MKSLSLTVSYSDVKRLVYTALFAVFALVVMSSSAWAADAATPIVVNNNAAKTCPEGMMLTPATGDYPCIKDPNYAAKQCKEAETELQTDQKAMTSACGKAGLGANCIKTIQRCVDNDDVAEQDPGIMDQILPLANQFMGTSMSMPSSGSDIKGCANKSERDFKDERDRLKTDLKEAQDDEADVGKEIAEVQEDLNKQMEDAKKDIAAAKKDLEEQKKALSKESRDELANLEQQQYDGAENLRRLNGQMLAQRADISVQEAKYAGRLREIVDITCWANVQKLREELDKLGLFSNGNFISQGNQKKDALQKAFNNCNDSLNAQRRNVATDRRNYLAVAQKNLNDLQTKIDEENSKLNSYSTRVQDAVKDIETSKSAAVQAVVQQIQDATAALQAAQTAASQKQTALAKKQAAATMRVSTLQADMGKMGTAPSSGATDGWRAAQSAVVDYSTTLSNLCGGECGSISKYCSKEAVKNANKAIKGSLKDSNK